MGFFSKKDAQKWIPIDVNKTLNYMIGFKILDGFYLIINQIKEIERDQEQESIHKK